MSSKTYYMCLGFVNTVNCVTGLLGSRCRSLCALRQREWTYARETNVRSTPCTKLSDLFAFDEQGQIFLSPRVQRSGGNISSDVIFFSVNAWRMNSPRLGKAISSVQTFSSHWLLPVCSTNTIYSRGFNNECTALLSSYAPGKAYKEPVVWSN